MSKNKTDDLQAIAADLITNPVDLELSEAGTCKYFDDMADNFKVRVVKYLRENNISAEQDAIAIEQLVRSYRKIVEYNYIIKQDGFMVEELHGMKPHPLLSLLNTEEKFFRLALGDFHLFTPKSRSNTSNTVVNKPLHGNKKQSNALRLINRG